MRRFLELGVVSGLFAASVLVACGPSVESTLPFSTSGGGETGGAGGAGNGAGGAGMGGAGQGGMMTSSSSSATGAGPASSSSSASASSSSSASSGGMGGAGGGFDPQVCGQCAFGNCQAEIFACGQACQSFSTCAQNCTDQACIDACLMQYPQAKPTYDCTCAACTAECGSFCPSGGNGASASASSGTGGGSACATCGQMLQGSQDPPCMGSDKLAQDLLTCTCQVNCTNPCAASCAGGQPDQTCFTCVQGKCGTQLNACIND